MHTAFVSAQKKSLFHMTEFSVLTDNTYKLVPVSKQDTNFAMRFNTQLHEQLALL